MKLGVFGGSFDPPHLGHLVAAQDACTALALDTVLFVPAAQPPHKLGRVLSPPELRLEMLEAALAADERFEACELELRRPGPSYTVETLRQLRGYHAGAELHLLMGADQFGDFASWREPDEILRLAHLVVLSREGREVPMAPAHLRLDVTRLDISASDIRSRVASGAPIRYLVPDPVEAIIRREGLYAAPETAPAVSHGREDL